MLDELSRTKLIYGGDLIEGLWNCRVAIFGVGGVGGYAMEALARSGIGTLDIIDDDKVCLTNINRQIIATRNNIGEFKADAAEVRIKAINPDIKVNKHIIFYLPENGDSIDLNAYDYIVDAIDTVKAKLDIIERASRAGVPIISAMGCGNRIDPTKLIVTDIYKTSVDPLAKVMRHELKKRHINKLKVVFSTEEPIRPLDDEASSCRYNCICPPGTQRKCTDRRDIPGSTAFVPPAAGLIIASEVVKDLTGFSPKGRTKGGRQN